MFLFETVFASNRSARTSLIGAFVRISRNAVKAGTVFLRLSTASLEISPRFMNSCSSALSNAVTAFVMRSVAPDLMICSEAAPNSYVSSNTLLILRSILRIRLIVYHISYNKSMKNSALLTPPSAGGVSMNGA